MRAQRANFFEVFGDLQGGNAKKRVQNNVTMNQQIPRKIQNNVTMRKKMAG